MASELRWILLAICVPLLVGIWWWGNRRSRQAPGNAELRESTIAAPVGMHAPAAAGGEADGLELRAGTREWGVPPLEPLNIRTAEFESVEVEPLTIAPEAPVPAAALEPPSAEHAARAAAAGGSAAEAPEQRRPAVVTSPLAAPPPAQAAPARPPAAPAHVSASPAVADAAATGTHAEAPNPSQTQRIITIRVGAAGETRWPGSALLAALENHGMAFGRYQVFHRRHSDGRTLFCAASLVEPGTFDLSQMPRQEFRGVTLFAVLPGPIEPLQTLNELILAAGQLAATLHGSVQDSKGRPLTQRQAEAIREDVAQFQAMLSVT